ncbi:MAG: recombinase family protein [Limisphaerales bacterium]
MNRATAVYVRVSSLDQRQDSQVKELKNHCRLRNWTNLVLYQDKLSGAEVARPELDRMMSDVRAGRVGRVVCFKLDRLGRSVAHLVLLMEELIRLHVPLIVTSQGIDTSEDNAAGRLQAHVIMAMAEFERSLIRERVRAGLAAARERGVRLGREPLLVKRVAEVKRLKKAGLGIRAIGRELGMPPSSVCKVWKLAS